MKRSLDTLAGFEDARPVGGRWPAIHQEGVGGASDIHDVGWAHPHAAPHQPVLGGRRKTLSSHVVNECPDGTLSEVVIVALLLEIRDDGRWILVGPVGQHDDVFAIPPIGLRGGGLEDQRTIKAGLFLRAAVTMIPVGARSASQDSGK